MEELLFSLSETVNISLFQKISSTADSKTDLMSSLQLKEAEGGILTRNLKGKIGKCKKRAGPASRGTGGA